MPFVRRIIQPGKTAEDRNFNPVMQGGAPQPVEKYVRKKALKPDDVVLDPTVTDNRSPLFIRDAVLQSLAHEYPKEFEAAATARGIPPLTVTKPEEDDEIEEEEDE